MQKPPYFSFIPYCLCYVGRILVSDAMIFNAVFSMSRFFVHSNRLRWSSQVLALANESTYDSQRNYLCLLQESSPIANGVVIDSLLSRHR